MFLAKVSAETIEGLQPHMPPKRRHAESPGCGFKSREKILPHVRETHEMHPNVFRFGALVRLRPYLNDAETLTSLDILNIWKLGPDDIVVSPRPRSTLLEALFFLRSPGKRPALITVADGYIFRQNSHKKCNMRYGWLNKHVIGDHMIVSQPPASLNEICQDLDAITSMVDYEVSMTETIMQKPKLVLLSGNDPFFDLSKEQCVAAFIEAYQELRSHFGPSTPIYLSAPNRRLSNPVLRASPGLRGIGRIADAGLSPDTCIFVGSPSTVLHEQFLARRPTFLLPLYATSGLERVCTEFSVLLEASSSEAATRLRYKIPQDLRSPPKFSIEKLAAISRRKRSPMFSPRQFFCEFQPIVLANELHLLLRGYRENRQ